MYKVGVTTVTVGAGAVVSTSELLRSPQAHRSRTTHSRQTMRPIYLLLIITFLSPRGVDVMTTILYNAICRLTRKEVEKIKNKLVTKRRKSREKPEKTCSCAAAVLSFPKRGTRRKGGTETDETESSYVARCAAAPVRLRRADGERRGSVTKRRSAGSRGAAEDIDAAANGSFPEPLPKPVTGVFLEDGKSYVAVTNIGVRPTVSEENRVSVESHLLDYSGNLYGRQARVEFYAFLRPERKFENYEALSVQIREDAEAARAYFEKQEASDRGAEA